MNTIEKFDYVFSNPPYQKNIGGSTLLNIYPAFVKNGSLLSKHSIMIHPARAFKGAGRVIQEDVDSVMSNYSFTATDVFDNGSTIFPHTEIKGGVIITKYVENQFFDNGLNNLMPIHMKTIVEKAVNHPEFKPISDSIFSFINNKISQKFQKEYKNEITGSNKSDFKTNIFFTMPQLFDDCFDEIDKDSTKVLGYENGKRTIKRIVDDSYVIVHEKWINKWKVFQPVANGSGILGENLVYSTIGNPQTIATQTYLTFGMFDEEYEAVNCAKYLHSRFALVLLYSLKSTQQNARKTWLNIPLQDFTKNSDIDWDMSDHNIDEQLYKKYNISVEEIEWLNSIFDKKSINE